MTRKLFRYLLLLGLLGASGVAAPVIASTPLLKLESEALQLTFRSQDGTFDITDKRNGRVWTQTVRSAAGIKVLDAKLEGATAIRCRLQTPAGRATAQIAITNVSEIVVTLAPEGAENFETVEFPAALRPSAPSAEWVLPASEGLLIRADRMTPKDLLLPYTWSQTGLLSPWFGLCEGGAGMMILVETADDFQLALIPTRLPKHELACAAVQWVASKTGLRYPRQLRYCVLSAGGYVEMAKRYRQYLQATGRFKTIAEKSKQLPQITKMVGAMDVFDVTPEGDQVVDWLISNGVKRVFYTVHGKSAGVEQYTTNRLQKAHAAGYLVSRFDNFVDIVTPERLKLLAKKTNPTPHDERQLVGYPDDCILTREGKPIKGWQAPTHVPQPDGTSKVEAIANSRRCPLLKLDWMKRDIPPELQAQQFDARLCDTETATPLFECYSSKHSMTRTDDRIARRGMWTYLNSLGLMCGSEGGADWACDQLVWQEGCLTLSRFGYLKQAYASGTPLEVPDDYLKEQFNPTIRVPLHELVFHDSTFMTWRWNHTPNRWTNAREYWDDWDLWHILYAQMPVFVIDANTDSFSPAARQRMLKTFRDVGGVLEKVGGREMMDHQFLTTDRSVQQTRFDNGVVITVNFGSQPYIAPDGKRVAPRSFQVQP